MGEAKIFESDGYVVTTDRFVYGNKVVPLDDIDNAMFFEYHNWGGVISIVVMGLAAFLCGAYWAGFIVILIGIALLVGAYFLATNPDRSVVIWLKSEEKIDFKVTKELGSNLANAIHTAISERLRLRSNALHDELSNLPSA